MERFAWRPAERAPVVGLPEPLRLFGTEEQKREWLPRVATDHIFAFLLPEPDVGSDPARLATAAIPVDGATAVWIFISKRELHPILKRESELAERLALIQMSPQ